MATYKLNPQAINPEWGVICLTLGKNKPENFDEILSLLKRIVDSKENFLVSVRDTEYNKFLGDCDIIYSDDKIHYIITQGRIDPDGKVTEFHYYFTTDGRYLKHTGFYNLKDMVSRISTLENKLNELTITE